MRVTFEVWRLEGDSQIHMSFLEGQHKDLEIVVDARANYSGGNPKLFKALEALLSEKEVPEE